ncbi:MAG: hypothetical protein ABIH45_03810 [Candidatus Omnitrophota bacterium]
MGKKNKVKDDSHELTEILFGTKPTSQNFWFGCWNPAYRYKKNLDKLPYYPVLQITSNRKNNRIEDIEIIFNPNHCKCNSKPLPTAIYNWVNPYFWIEKGFYPKTKFERTEYMHEYFAYKYPKQREKVRKHPFEEDFEIIFNDIWKLCVLKEGKALISQHDFTEYIWLIRYLVENTFVFPLKEINWHTWGRDVSQYLDEAESISIFERNTENLLGGWHITEKDTSNKIQAIYISDIKKILNMFFENNKPDNGLGLFLNKIYSSFAEELEAQKIFTKCACCGDYFLYKKGKKFCSFLDEKKNCGKSARNKRYYEQHSERIKNKSKACIEKARKSGNYIDKRRLHKS